MALPTGQQPSDAAEEAALTRDDEEFLDAFGHVYGLWPRLDWVARWAIPRFLWDIEPAVRDRLLSLPELVDTSGLNEADRSVATLLHDNDGEKDHYWSNFHSFTFALCLLQPACLLIQLTDSSDTADGVLTKLLAETARTSSGTAGAIRT